MSSFSPIQPAPKRGDWLSTTLPFLPTTRAPSVKTWPVASATPGTASTRATSAAGIGGGTSMPVRPGRSDALLTSMSVNS